MCSLDNLKSQYSDVPDEVWMMLDNIDAFTFNHSVRVCGMCQIVEKEMHFPDTILSEAGLLHDIGKYYISQQILEKRGPLSAAERYFINAHAFLSYDTLMRFGLPKEVCDIALYHHTLQPMLFDKKLPECKDEKIQRLALIMKTIDIFEAVTSDRPYHRGVTVASAVKYFVDIEHDPDVLNILVNASDLNRT
jgi:putative nucleotidyltransferase with HDIG domain